MNTPTPRSNQSLDIKASVLTVMMEDLRMNGPLAQGIKGTEKLYAAKALQAKQAIKASTNTATMIAEASAPTSDVYDFHDVYKEVFSKTVDMGKSQFTEEDYKLIHWFMVVTLAYHPVTILKELTLPDMGYVKEPANGAAPPADSTI